MAYFQEVKQRRVAWFAAASGIYVAIVLATLFAHSGGVRALSPGQALGVSLGPFHFLDIQKTAHAGGGYELDFAFKAGLAIFLLMTYVIVLLISRSGGTGDRQQRKKL